MLRSARKLLAKFEKATLSTLSASLVNARPQRWRNAKQDDIFIFRAGKKTTPIFTFRAKLRGGGAFCEQPAGAVPSPAVRGACSSHRPAAGTVVCRRRRALAAPNDDLSGRIVRANVIRIFDLVSW